jgi:hypothetical protein
MDDEQSARQVQAQIYALKQALVDQRLAIGSIVEVLKLTLDCLDDNDVNSAQSMLRTLVRRIEGAT